MWAVLQIVLVSLVAGAVIGAWLVHHSGCTRRQAQAGPVLAELAGSGADTSTEQGKATSGWERLAKRALRFLSRRRKAALLFSACNEGSSLRQAVGSKPSTARRAYLAQRA